MRLIFLILLCSIAQLSLSQKEFKGGILFGPVTTQISGDGLGGWDKFGFTAGAWVNVPLGEQSGISIEMKYINKGSRTKQDTLTFQSFGYYLNYIDVPLLFTYVLRQKEKTSFTLTTGPYFGYLLNQKIKANSVDSSVPIPFEIYDIGFEIGGAFWFSKKFYSKLILTSSVIPTRPNPSQVNALSYYEKGNYNQTIQLTFGLRFGGKAE